MKNLRFAAALCAVLGSPAAIGCGEQDPSVFDAVTPLSPVALRDSLVFVDSTGHHAFVLDASAEGDQAEAKLADLPFAPILSERRNEHDEALVLCAGRRSSQSSEVAPAALAVVTSDGKTRSYELGTTPFDTIAQSGDGRYAVLLRTGEGDGRVVSNPNQIAVIDLDAKPSSKAAVTTKAPRSFGHTPEHVVFSPPMRVAGEDRRLLVVLSESEVTLIDLGHLDRRETIVQLGGAENRSIFPTQVLFGAGEPTLYVRGEGADDIFVFRLEPTENEGGNDFRPSINQLGGGVGPSDMALFGDVDDPRLLVVSRVSAQVIVVDPSSSKATPIALPIVASRVLVFRSTSPDDDVVRERALIYGLNTDQVVFLDLHEVEAKKGRNVETLAIDSAIASIIPLLDEDKVVLLQAGTGVSVLDLAQRTVAPIDSTSELSSALFDATNQWLWVGPVNQPRLGTLDLASGGTDEILLDANIKQLVPLFSVDKLAVIHASAAGYVTFIDTREPGRETARSVRGFFFADALDRGEQ